MVRLKAQLEQGSQQTQGEVLELQVEDQLRRLFPQDEITEVKKGQRGADVTQVVKTPLGVTAGIILWEAKNAQWQASWHPKLRADMREAGVAGPVFCDLKQVTDLGRIGPHLAPGTSVT